MPEDDVAAAGIGQHLGADIAGEGALWQRRGNPVRPARCRCRRAQPPTADSSVAGGQISSSQASAALRSRLARALRVRAPAPSRRRATRSSSSCRRRALSDPPWLSPAYPSMPGRCCGPARASLSSPATITPAFGPVNRPGPLIERPSASMLQAIRSKAGSFVVKALFVVLILTFGIWGIGDIFRNRPTDTTVATVGDQSIDAEGLQTAVQPALERLSARLGDRHRPAAGKADRCHRRGARRADRPAACSIRKRRGCSSRSRTT